MDILVGLNTLSNKITFWHQGPVGKVNNIEHQLLVYAASCGQFLSLLQTWTKSFEQQSPSVQCGQ